jgi:hypothetical protein
MAFVKQAGIDAPRTGGGTVPGTVPGVISGGALAGVSGGVFSAILRPTCTAMAGPFWQVICGWVLAAVASPTFRPVRIATRRPICGAIRRVTCGGISVATSTAFCRSRGSNGNGLATKSRKHEAETVTRRVIVDATNALVAGFTVLASCSVCRRDPSSASGRYSASSASSA